MATEKTINARMQMKTDTALNWSKAINFIPKKGEIIIYEADSDHGYERMKIGDGSTKVNDLPFVIGAKDWNQNDSTASDYIKNRPGGYTVNYPALDIEWDGVTGDRVSVDVDGRKYVKVSDEIPKSEQLVGGSFTLKVGNASNTVNIADEYINDFGNGIYGLDPFVVVNKAPANFVNPDTGDVMAVFQEMGVYFAYIDNGDIMYVSSLSIPAKSEIVPIPGELTNIVGGYVGKERNEPLIDEVVPASSFEPYTTSPETYYEAPITLGFTPADGDLIRGTINGVEVNGQWIGRSKYAKLYRVGNRDVPFCAIGFRSEKAAISLQQASAPTTDYEIHLYRYVPSGIVQIPQEYVEGLEETTANANQALETATAAQSTANAAKSTADAAQSIADEAKSTADAAQCIGREWIKSSNNGLQFKDIVYGNGVWVGGTYSGIRYSFDGKKWYSSDTTDIHNIVYHSGIFVAGKPINSSSLDYLKYSRDGIHWKNADAPQSRYSVKVCNNRWFALGDSEMLYSDDGISWIESMTENVYDVTYMDGIYVASGELGFYYSSDGTIWNTAEYSDWARGGYELAYSNGVCVAVQYTILNNTLRKIAYTTDGKTWSSSNMEFAGSAINANDMWFVFHDSTRTCLYYSIDGKTWIKTNIPSYTVDYITKAIVYNNGLYVAVGDGIRYSEDGINWFVSNMGYNDSFDTIVCVDNILIAVGKYGIAYSIDGKVWETAVVPTDASSRFNDVVYANGMLQAIYYGTWGTAYSERMFARTDDMNFNINWIKNQIDTLYTDAQRVGGDVIIPSSTSGSTKKFKIMVDDTGTISTTEVTI